MTSSPGLFTVLHFVTASLLVLVVCVLVLLKNADSVGCEEVDAGTFMSTMLKRKINGFSFL